MSGFVRRYGATPLHLLSVLTCFALAGYAALQASHGPLPLRMVVWFVGAVVLHDLVLFPLYALADRALSSALPRRRTEVTGGLNFVRVPALLSGLLFVVFFPLILRRSEGPYGVASGLDQSPYLAHWLLITAVLFGGSAVLFALSHGRRGSQHAVDSAESEDSAASPA